jgi:hypothetical protein
MAIEKTNKSLFMFGVLVLTTIAFGLGIYANTFLSRRDTPFLTEGFDFNMLRSSQVVWRGPEIGLKVDLSRLKGKDGKTLASVVGNKPIMLGVTNPDCGLCRTAADEMGLLRLELAKRNINYYVLFFPKEIPATDFFKYSESLEIGAEAFLWDSQSGPPPESIFTMTSPSHMLVNNDGTVIRVWPGSYKDKPVRDRMAHQILADTYVVLDTLTAVSSSNEKH